MKTLYLVRHAKSSWKFDVPDHLRPLKGRGKRDAQLVSQHVATTISKPQKMISSDAVRALSTARYFEKAFNMQPENFLIDNELYDFSGQQVMRVIKNLEDTYESYMLFGHNHAFTSIANMLGNDYIDNVPTCGFVALTFDVNSWKDINVGTTMFKVFPRDLKK